MLQASSFDNNSRTWFLRERALGFISPGILEWEVSYLTQNPQALTVGDRVEIGGFFTGKSATLSFLASDSNVFSLDPEEIDSGLVRLDATAGNLVGTLPDISSSSLDEDGFVTIKRIDSSSFNVTMLPSGGGTIDGENLLMIKPRESYKLIADKLNNNWDII